ncbi:L-lactate dehydrogenase [Rouxiella sp. Mn2063]|uniref:L-lactate dehydrogenase n=1 Tax=Rouxiella sp. Mn2063 TaxID=3395262 RepID=UPI003BE7A80D
MTRKVAIIGAGHVGADTAFSLVTQGLCDTLVLIDQDEKKAHVQSLELRDMASFTPSRVSIIAGDYAELADTDVIVIAVGPTTLLKEDRLEELAETRAAVLEIVPRIISSGFQGVIVNITNPCDVITQIIQQTSGLLPSQVFGTGTSLDTARMKRVVGEFFSVDPKSVQGYVLGEHGESQFVAWSTVAIGGIPVAQLAGDRPVDWAQMDASVRQGGWQILQGKGWTSFGIATATARLVDAILSDANTVYPVSAWSESQKVYIGHPAIIGRKGVVQSLLPELTAYENIAFQASARVIAAALNK